MKALTLWQPWASLVIGGFKSLETRVWSTKYRGTLAIHAAQRIPFKELGASRFQVEFHKELEKCLTCDIASLPVGVVLGTATLCDVVAITKEFRSELSHREMTFGNYDTGRYAWHLDEVNPFRTPIPAKGNRMLWNWEK